MSNLRIYRKKAGLTLEALAAQLGTSVASLSRIENGMQWPDREFFERLSEATNGEVTPNDFLPSDTPARPSTEAA